MIDGSTRSYPSPLITASVLSMEQHHLSYKKSKKRIINRRQVISASLHSHCGNFTNNPETRQLLFLTASFIRFSINLIQFKYISNSQGN